MSASFDAIVVGAGHNGLVAAVTLAEAGWDVVVVEANAHPGGALSSGELTRPGYVHDRFATNLNLFLASAFYADHNGALARHGFVAATSPRPFATAFAGGAALGVTTDLDETLARLSAHDRADAAGWRRLHELFGRLAPTLFALYGARVPSISMGRLLAGGLWRLGRNGSEELARLLLSSCRELLDDTLATDEAKALIAPWGLHLDFGPDVAGGAVFPFLEAFADQSVGMSVARGGASRLVDALCALLVAHGGTLRTCARVTRITTSGGRATGVELASGERLAARRAVLACVTPTALAAELLAPGDLPAPAQRSLAAYRYGPATMMVHLALAGPIPWSAGTDLASFAYVHVAAGLDELARTYSDALAGRLPANPLLVVGQTSAVDPTRAPEGGHVVWIQVRALPRRILDDPGGELAGQSWDEAAEPYAERVIDQLERHAPGTRGLVTGRAVLSPADLERHDANLAGGDSISGSMHLAQSFLFRPALGMSGYRTPLPGLLLIGAGTWPGPGLNAVSGQRAAGLVLDRSRRWW
ncbi:MAG TPA: NAD(P)/FAD-dependent oxidoreductase [Acidimicrobiales bacterium]|nr:NAD(P)/FAD-dependent oxidoreductase [Acidimicrobiales bacterium]